MGTRDGSLLESLPAPYQPLAKLTAENVAILEYVLKLRCPCLMKRVPNDVESNIYPYSCLRSNDV